MATGKSKGVSLAKGPAALIGVAALVYGITALIFGDRSFAAEPLDGMVDGGTWLGIEVNGWTSLLFIVAGALLLFGAPFHWTAKGTAVLVGLALGVASVMLLVDGDDVFGVFAGNGLTALVLGIGAAVLLIVGLLPRVGGRKEEPAADRGRVHDPALERDRALESDPVRERPVERERVVEREVPPAPLADRGEATPRETPVVPPPPGERTERLRSEEPPAGDHPSGSRAVGGRPEDRDS